MMSQTAGELTDGSLSLFHAGTVTSEQICLLVKNRSCFSDRRQTTIDISLKGACYSRGGQLTAAISTSLPSMFLCLRVQGLIGGRQLDVEVET